MNMDLLENPVTVIVKAPNQRIADQTVDCMLGWTVRKLKQHLKDVYPSQPSENEQKLIYSGRLLPDHLTLKEILRQFDKESHHIMHLVCASVENQIISSSAAPVNTPPKSQPENELRYRGHNTPQSSPAESSQQQPPQSYAPPQMPNSMFNPMVSMPQMPPPSSTNTQGYTPEQYMWMQQQMYMQQYYSQYMQYYQTGVVPPVTTTAPAPQAVTHVVPAPPNNAAVAPQPVRNDQQVQMNAQGGAMVDDDEMGQWDWLDWIYALCRFSVLLGIVYSYSTLNRFAIVSTAFIIVYMLQAGWFRGRWNRQNAEENQRQPEPQQPEPNPEPNNEQENQQNAQDSESENKPEEPATPATPVPAPAPAPPGVLSIVWCFLSTFVTSLIPQAPADVNAN